ncbi:hypothetical protein ACSRUE_43435 [Sorangium sp. KYC3313]|uniref:hypothetical protein n=1 Tax=Sorangium sp. KYC3313 TaxID=3449740 RepID=UPI003F8B020D
MIRTLAKRTRTTKLFKQLQEKIRKACRQGVLLNGRPTPRIFYASEIEPLELGLWVDLDTQTIRATLGR